MTAPDSAPASREGPLPRKVAARALLQQPAKLSLSGRGRFGHEESVADRSAQTRAGETLRCSPEENAEAIDATIGGMGPTGFILSVRLGVLPIRTPLVRFVKRRTKNLDALLSLLCEEPLLLRLDRRPRPRHAPGRDRAGRAVRRLPFLLGPLSTSAFNAARYAAGRGTLSFPRPGGLSRARHPERRRMPSPARATTRRDRPENGGRLDLAVIDV